MIPMNAPVSSPSSMSPRISPSSVSDSNAKGSDHTMSLTLTAFDKKPYLQLIRAQGNTIRGVVDELKPQLNLANALDAGCGVGFFAQALHECGLDVCGFDGRLENVVEARRRFPRIPFGQGDIEDPDIARLGVCDLVLCFGLLYHLENPMLAIRHLRALTGKGLLLESMCLPGADPGMMMREEPSQEDQSLTDIALYPSEGCLVKMLYRAGFAAVYRVAAMPDHDDFRETSERARRRTVLFASVAPVRSSCLEAIVEPRDHRDPWARDNRLGFGRAAKTHSEILRRPARTKYISLAQHARSVFSGNADPLRLPFGAWWLAEKGALDHELIHDGFEGAETTFVGRLLRLGMTVLDIGAHHGLYTLLASKRVGREGRVIAFEPSP
jgi:SAM-dependent methyltransferase